MRNLVAKAFEVPIHSPGGGRDPTKPSFDEYETEPREPLGDALNHQADELRRHGVSVGVVFFVVVGRPSAAGRGVAAVAADVDPQRQPRGLPRGKDRPIAPSPERLISSRRYVHLDVVSCFGATLDFRHGRLGVVLANQDRRPKPRLWLRPAFDLPFVYRPLDGGAELEIL